ncbi:hypothetical protein HYALB_00009092 [Hymenoscyphus albidus]|uniref:MFS general substrate transporter n=1 Tax=Hymenoscyphus albidus TaxID=595503 RepID=A0A9N9PVT8_9HELO|nr:hypothetical protein HYALB_00009092 [Hymenoscyphus albidus]
MAVDEATLLLAQHTSEGQDGKTTVVGKANQGFALWQAGALCGILLACADTSLVWAIHETIASRFGCLEYSSWMMTSFTLGYYIAAPSDVAVLRSYVNVASTVGFSVGGPLGGFLSSTIGQVPIATGCCIVIVRGVRKQLSKYKETTRQPQGTENESNTDGLAFDFPGAISFAFWMSSLLVVIDLQHHLSWGHPLVLSITIVGSISFLSFILFETFPGKRELLIPLRLLKTEIGAFCASNGKAGARTIPYSVGNAMGNLIAGQVTRKIGKYKRLSLVSLLLCIANSLLIIFQWSHSLGTWDILTTLPLGLFGGMILSSQFIGMYHNAPKEQMATAIGMYYMSQQVGIALGITLTSSLFKQQFEATLKDTLANVPRYEEIIKVILRDSSAIALLPTGVRYLVSQSYLRSFWVVPVSITVMEALAILPMISTTEKYST